MNVDSLWVTMSFNGCQVFAQSRHLLMVSDEVDAIVELRANAPEFSKVRMAMQHIAESLIAMEPRGSA